MPNQPRPDNPARHVRVEDPVWEPAAYSAAAEGTTRAEVMRRALEALNARNPDAVERWRQEQAAHVNGPHPEHTGQGPGRLVRRRP